MTYAITLTHDTGHVDILARAPTKAQAMRRAKRAHWHRWGDGVIATVEFTRDCECGGVVDLSAQCVVCRCMSHTHPHDRAAWTPIGLYRDATYLRQSADALDLLHFGWPHTRYAGLAEHMREMADEMSGLTETSEEAA